MLIRTLLVIACALACAEPAFAEPPPAAVKAGTPRRRAEKLDQAQSQAARADRVVSVPEIEITGKPQRPLVTVEIAVKPFDFPVGTARYSDRNQRFLQTRRNRL